MTSQIELLAQAIADNTERVGDHLRSHNLLFPSFKVDAPVKFVLEDQDVENARQEAIANCLELVALLQEPQMSLRPCLNAAPLQAIYKLDVAQKVPLNGDISFTELAKQCGVEEPDMRCIVRFTIVHHRTFCEPRIGHVAHTAASRQLAENEHLRDGIGLMFDDFYQSFARTVEALQTFKGKEPSQTGWALAHNSTHQSTFDYLADHPSRARRFGGAMRFFSATEPGTSPSHLVSLYPWATLGSATVVDVGGADGYVSAILAQSFPSLHVIVEDLLHIVQRATVPQGLEGRMQFVAQDFFEVQAIKDADVYLLRWVLHDWPDQCAIKILRNLIPALKRGSRVIINDNVSPGQAGSLPLMQERFIRELDMIMLSVFNAYERELHDWKRIISEADARFGPVKHTKITGALLGILEIEWLG